MLLLLASVSLSPPSRSQSDFSQVPGALIRQLQTHPSSLRSPQAGSGEGLPGPSWPLPPALPVVTNSYLFPLRRLNERMNVNLFICENLLLFFFHFVLFGGFSFFWFVFFSVCLLRERGLPRGCLGSPHWERPEAAARAVPASRSLAHSVSHMHFFFQNWDPSC